MVYHLNMFLFKILKQTLAGKSLTRGLLNLAIGGLCLKLSGKIVDLGSGAKRPSYFKFVSLVPGTEIKSIDINPKNKPDIIADISIKIPLDANSVESLFLINTMYLIAEPERTLRECHRILKKDGRLLVNFPLIWPIGNEPIDYWRYTDNSIKLLLDKAGLKIDKIVFYGERISSAESLLDNYFPQFLKVLIHPLTLLGDFIFTKITNNPSPCPTGMLVLASKKVNI